MNAPALPKTALVTGAAKRLGREIALTLARAGWQVAIHYRSSADEASVTLDDCRRIAPGLRFERFAADLADETQGEVKLVLALPARVRTAASFPGP